METKKEARAIDLAERLGVSTVTVSKTIQRLMRDGYIRKEPYRSIFLTEKGIKLATEAAQRHEIVLSFLMALGVPTEIAEIDTEGIEHHVSDQTLQIMKDFIKR